VKERQRKIEIEGRREGKKERKKQRKMKKRES
jgi:hypothetical protein